MDWKSVQESDLVGISHIESEGQGTLTSYYQTLDCLRPLFNSQEFQQLVSGYYLNRIWGNTSGGKDTVRIKYFVPKPAAKAAEEIIKKFIKDSGLSEVEPTTPRVEKVAQGNGGEKHELSFRRFLTLETCIGFELTEAKTNREEIRFLMKKFRQQNPRGLRGPGKNKAVASILESDLERHSKTFRSLKPNHKSFFWSGLSKHNWDWSHFFVNLVYGDEPPEVR